MPGQEEYTGRETFGVTSRVPSTVLHFNTDLGLLLTRCRGQGPHPKMRPLPRYGVSREVPCSALNVETVPDSLPATPKSPPTRRVPPRALAIYSVSREAPSLY